MGLPIRLEKHDEAPDQCVYTVGTPDRPMARVVVHKDSGDIELETLPSPNAEPNERYYLAQALPRLRRYHETGRYPKVDEWEA